MVLRVRRETQLFGEIGFAPRPSFLSTAGPIAMPQSLKHAPLKRRRPRLRYAWSRRRFRHDDLLLPLRRDQTMTTAIDASLSARYQADLRDYLRAVVSEDGTFCCNSADHCRSSIPGNHGLAAGQLSYVGSGYATTDDHKPLRILVVSMQVGDAEAPVSMGRRTEQVRVRIPQAPKDRNAHMRGVTFALQLLFGREPVPEQEFLDDGTHVLDAYAMANSALCSNLPTQGESRRGAPTGTMLERCGLHLRRTIEILQPTVIHTQGRKRAGQSTHSTLADIADETDWTSDWNAHVRIGPVDAIWCSLPHPSSGPPQAWQWTTSKFFEEVAAPNLRAARELALG